MKKTILRIGALALCLVMALPLFGCSTKDRGDEVAATVDGTPVYMWEVDSLFAQNKTFYEGLSDPPTDLDDPNNYLNKRKVLQTVLEQAIDQKVLYLCALEQGYGLTDEELAQLDADIEANTQKQVDFFVESTYKGQENAEQKALDHYMNYLAENALNLERLKQLTIEQRVTGRLTRALIEQQGTATDEELRAQYLTGIEEQKALYAEKPDQFAEDMRYWSKTPTVFHVPFESRRVKHLRVPFPDDIQSQLDAKQAEADAITQEALLLIEDPAEQAKYKDENEAQAHFNSLMDQVSALGEQIDALAKQGADSSEQTARDIAAQATSDNFDQMIEQYNADATMSDYDGRTFGIVVYAEGSYYPEFTEAALALTQPGQLSEPVKTDGGWYIIQLMENIPQGDLPFDDIKPYLLSLTQTQQTEELSRRYADEQKQGRNIKRNIEKLR